MIQNIYFIIIILLFIYLIIYYTVKGHINIINAIIISISCFILVYFLGKYNNKIKYKNCKYVSSGGIAHNCDIYPDIRLSDTLELNPLLYSNIKNNDKVYVISSALDKFCSYILPILEKKNIKIKLITGNSDKGVPVEISQLHRINYLIRFFIQSKSIIIWYTQNYDLPKSHPRIKPIPLGLDYHTLQKTNHWWGPKRTPLQQDIEIDTIYKNSNLFGKRKNKSFSFYHFNMFNHHGADRYMANDILKNKDFNIFLHKKQDRNTTWKLCSSYKFIISPHGNGLDCHRTYEAMCLGCIPIVRSSSLDILYKDMPIIILDSWKNINMDNLLEQSKRIIKRSREKLTLKYWVDYINNTK